MVERVVVVDPEKPGPGVSVRGAVYSPEREKVFGVLMLIVAPLLLIGIIVPFLLVCLDNKDYRSMEENA